VSSFETIVRQGDEFIAHLRSRRQPRIFIISGPSGVGKDAVIERLRESEVDTHFAITATTREMRENEIDGLHYFFVSMETFADWVEAGKLLEHAWVYENRYGVPREPVRAALARGEDVIIKIDVQGAAAIRSLVSDAISIFLAPESMERLYARLSARKTDDGEALARRFAEAGVELERANEFDYIVFNETNGILRAVSEIRSILLAERSRYTQPSIEV
jgi:guanylate kinase